MDLSDANNNFNLLHVLPFFNFDNQLPINIIRISS
jgi:hypothetical protein